MDEKTNDIMQKIHNLIILDASGSMSSIRTQAVNGFNETVQTIREAQEKHPEQQHTVTLVVFNSSATKTVYDGVPAAQAKDMTPDEYRPNCSTPLFDAMGFSINTLREKVEKGDTVLVTIITDGEENCSNEFNRNSIKALVDELKAEGWVFTYMGANQDVEKVAMSISISNHILWESTAVGTQTMFKREKKARTRFFDRLAMGESASDMQADYYDEI